MLARSLARGLATQAPSKTAGAGVAGVAGGVAAGAHSTPTPPTPPYTPHYAAPYTLSPVVHLPLTPWPLVKQGSTASSSPAAAAAAATPSTSSGDTPSDSAPSSTAHASTSTSTSTSRLPDGQPPSTPPTPLSYVQLPSYIFSSPPRPDILHQCVVAHLASQRQGTAATKNRAQVRGSGRKLMMQKGTGKARVGSRQSPIRRGGGHAFAKRAKDWSLGLNRKVWELGVRTALSERWRRGELAIIPTTPVLPGISTRNLVESFRQHPFARQWSRSKTLFLLSTLDETFALSARNLPNVEVRLVDDIDVYSTLQGNNVVMDLEAVQLLEDWLGRDATAAAGGLWSDVVQEVDGDLRAMPEGAEMEQLSNELQAMLTMPLHQAAAGTATLSSDEHGGHTNTNDGGIKRQDVVIEQEEAPVKEKRHDREDPLKERTEEQEAQDDKGDAIRQHMDELAQDKDKNVRSEDAPSPKDL